MDCTKDGELYKKGTSHINFLAWPESRSAKHRANTIRDSGGWSGRTLKEMDDGREEMSGGGETV